VGADGNHFLVALLLVELDVALGELGVDLENRVLENILGRPDGRQLVGRRLVRDNRAGSEQRVLGDRYVFDVGAGRDEGAVLDGGVDDLGLKADEGEVADLGVAYQGVVGQARLITDGRVGLQSACDHVVLGVGLVSDLQPPVRRGL
jgi:hypothetical protein